MKHILFAASVGGLIALGGSGVSLAQNSPVTVDQVTSACSIETNRDDCLLSASQYVGAVEASTAATDVKSQDINTLIASLVPLARSEGCPNDFNDLIAEAIAQVGTQAGDLVDGETVLAISSGVKTCNVDITTAALTPPPPASPG